MTNNLALVGGAPVRTRPFPSWPIFDQADEARVLAALRSGKWGRLAGEQVAEFENRFATMHGCRHGIAVVNGTVSLRIALMAAGITAGASAGTIIWVHGILPPCSVSLRYPAVRAVTVRRTGDPPLSGVARSASVAHPDGTLTVQRSAVP